LVQPGAANRDGKRISTEVETASEFITDPVVTEYINQIGQNLVRNSDSQVPFRIRVIDSEEINAVALPGDSSTWMPD